jgi:NADPH-dependent 2,4-dienoyl-CoA reductase/sulfur reductase-like enzyme
VVIGAGPAGLEAARASGERGHAVTLFESAERTGGQLNLAIKGPWREPLSGITRWLDREVHRLGVDVRLRTTATPEMVTSLDPDVVIVATGGRPCKGRFEGSDLAVSSWDILSGQVEPGKNVLFWDDNGQHQGLSTAEFLAKRGSLVEFVTPDRHAAHDVGITNFPVHMRELYKHGVIFTADHRLIQVSREGNKLIAVLRNEYSNLEEEREVDQIVAEHGTLPLDELYFALKPSSINHGELNIEILAEQDRVVDVVHDANAKFRLYRVGDAVTSRNIYAALLDSLRLCHDL